LLSLALLPVTSGCNETKIPKPDKPDPRIVAEELAQQQALEKKIRAAQATWDDYFIEKLEQINANQEDKANFYKEVESLADEVLDYNTSVLRGYHYDALPKLFIAFEKFAIENIEGFKPKYDPLYSKPRDQRERDHNESICN
jgi:hypothetical protein